ncbi:MAG TPA: BREX-3 system P-loop-containing protein BrxF [Methylomusa anaerophila]|uniref:BREX-3 system P-loop-containing protein BrxF n=1 Tax=Methylomusa anaerophila TaxID=1930071 RepID=A0A348AJT9_9FIRM|nr:BREX-3 system P-loop-containing protein BrxF [Methylomusa anaerophila]BBB91337.1 hypothetical protein MAMMFC1_02015 [Methylomusa anaerophila]HML90488.1 BREX-3 system P-loop-containing protein BrxF [Methylomusa anaerophila]
MEVTITHVVESVREVGKKGERLVIIAGKPGSGKSKIMRELSEMRGWVYVDSKTLLTDELFEMSPKARAGEAANIMDEVLEQKSADVILLDNTQVLFAPVLQVNPLTLLRRLSQKQTVVAAWPGSFENGELVYSGNMGSEPVSYSGEGLKVVAIS